MTPTVDERIASIIRALSGVILPSLPPEAGLAQEQVHLCMGHLQILRAQLDAIPQYEADELADTLGLGRALGGFKGGPRTQDGLSTLGKAVAQGEAANGAAGIREARIAINDAIATLVAALSTDGDADDRRTLHHLIVEQESKRALKDRRWFAPFGFDDVPAGE